MSQLKYRADVDGLRALAVVAVMIYHAFPSVLQGGFVGVDVFFVISGYLISGIILDALDAGRFTFSGFYARRIRRIFPALSLVLVAALAAGWYWLYVDDYARLGRQAAAGAGFVSNFVLWQESSYFDVAASLKPLLHLWSLGVEEQFYFVWPLILVITSRWRRGPIIGTLVIGSISFAIAIYTVRLDRTAAFFAPWTRFWELLAGATLACVERDTVFETALQWLESRSAVRNLQAIVGLVMIVVGTVVINDTRVFPGLWVWLPVAGTALLIVSGPGAIINRTLLSWRLVVWVGLISYPLYLWHWPLLSFVSILRGEVSGSIRLAILALSVVLASLTYIVLERPIRFGTRRRGAVAGLAVVMAAACAFGIVIDRTNGWLDRPVNRNDAARLVEYYERMRKAELAGPYRRECDFMEWQTERTRDGVDPSCTAPGRAHTIFLWGDSFAQALSQGLRDGAAADTAVAQVTTSACGAAVDNFDLSVPGRRCEKANLYAIAAIRRLRPDLVVIAQGGGHQAIDWPTLSDRVLALGAKRVVVVGPFPVWRPGLPRIYAERHISDHAEYVSAGLDTSSFEIDRAIAERLTGRAGVTYLSLLDHLCPLSRRERFGGTSQPACLARVPGEGPLDLMALDFGHLTPKGSSYLGRVIWQPLFASMIR